MSPLALAPIGTLLISTLGLSLGYWGIGLWQASVWLLGLVLVWLFSRKRQWGAANGLILVGLYATAAVGLGLSAQPFLMVAAAMAALAAWDLMEFERSLQRADLVNASGFIKAHTIALSVALLSSVVFILLAGAIDSQLPFAIALILAVLLAASMQISINILKASQ